MRICRYNADKLGLVKMEFANAENEFSASMKEDLRLHNQREHELKMQASRDKAAP